MKDKTIKQFITYSKTEYKLNKYITKEIRRSKESKRITEWVDITLEKEISKYLFIPDAIKTIADGLSNKLDYLRLFNFLIPMSTVPMDGYALGRIFKKFKKVKNAPPEPCSIIMYAGSAHTDNYIDFLKNTLKFKTITESINNVPEYESNCVNISKLRHPLFTDEHPF